ncbi:MAG: GxxExxY protein [Chitinophagaceae bacterium]
MSEIRNEYFPLKDETDAIIRLGFEVYTALGFGFLEVVYKDAIEYEFRQNDILFERKKEYIVHYKDTLLKHRFLRTSLCLILLF